MKLPLRYKLTILLGILIIAIYFLLRLPNLTLQPIFADEAIYIRWAQVMRSEPTLRFLPLSDGKTPLFMWTLIPLLKVFDDPLFAGRFLSVLTGFITLTGVFVLSWKVFNLRVALWSSLIYAIVPYSVFFDRMALVDSMLAAFTIWSLFLAVWLLKTQRLDLAMILGYILGAGILTKTPGMLSLLVLPLTILGFDFKNKRKFLVKLIIFWLVAIFIALTIYNILRLGPNFSQLSGRNSDYIFSPLDLIGRPLDPFIPHLIDMFDWFPKLLTWPILVFIIAGIGWVIKEKNRLGLVVLIWGLVPLLIQMTFLKTFTARYLLFSIPPLLIMGGYGLEKLSRVVGVPWVSKGVIKLAASVILIVLPLRFDYLLLTDPAKVPLPKEDRRGYLEDWTAGYGFPEIAQFLMDQKKTGSVVVGTEGYFGTLPDGLQIYLDKGDIPIIGDRATISGKLRDAAKINQTFFIGNKNRVGINLERAKLIKEYPKVKPLDNSPQDAIVVFEVEP